MGTPLIDLIEERKKRIKENKKYLYELLRDKQMYNKKNQREAIKVVNEIVKNKNQLEFEVEGAYQNEPFGWPPGTVRGIITICVTLTFLILVMHDFLGGVNIIPMDWFLGIVGAVILSYFYTRYRTKI